MSFLLFFVEKNYVSILIFSFYKKMFPYKQTPSQQVLWKIIWKMSSEWPHSQPLPSSGWRRKFIREVDLTNTRWRCTFSKNKKCRETIADSGWASHCLPIFEKSLGNSVFGAILRKKIRSIIKLGNNSWFFANFV